MSCYEERSEPLRIPVSCKMCKGLCHAPGSPNSKEKEKLKLAKSRVTAGHAPPFKNKKKNIFILTVTVKAKCIVMGLYRSDHESE